MSPAAALAIRPGRDADAARLIALMGAVWGEYDGIVFDVDAELPELHALASHFAARGGRLWVAERADGAILGMIGMAPAADGGVELHKLYVARAARRLGLASRLLALVEDEARARGAAFIELKTDTRFRAAHAFYERHGFARLPGEWPLHDLSNSIEFGYRKALAPSP
ncbi:MAG: GNAT family N-acetyltransferase [Reyranellaceae bacterium]